MDKQVWYIAQDRQGFTSQPEFALKTKFGPLVCPGEVRRIESSVLERINQLWEYLLDQMEKLYELEDELKSDPDEDPIAVIAQEEVVGTLVDALAILEYGWTFKHEPENARQLVRNQAEVRYNNSVEAG